MKQALLPRLARLGIALSAALSPLAHAGLVTSTTTASRMSATPFASENLSYRRFDDDLGVLREVRLTYDFTLHQTIVYSNLGNDPARLNVGYGGGVYVSGPVAWGKNTDQRVWLDVPAHTPEASFEYDWAQQFTTTLTQDLDRFIGDTPAWMNISMHADVRSNAGGYLGIGSMSSIRLNVRFDYVYDTPPPPPPAAQALPEPSSLSLALGACLAAVCFQRRRRGSHA